MGTPLLDALYIVHNLLVGAGIRDRVKVIASGKIISGFALFRTLALGADLANSARGFMFALGCIQSLKCHVSFDIFVIKQLTSITKRQINAQ